MYENRPVLFAYCSETDTWRSAVAAEDDVGVTRSGENNIIFLSVIHRRRESVIISAAGPESERPIVFRPRFDGGVEGLAVGLIAGDAADRLHVYGDGKMAVVRSDGEVGSMRVRAFVIICIELWGVSLDGNGWDFICRVPKKLIERIKKPYGVMMGCLEERDGVVRVVLLSNYEGLWDLIWLFV
ncbi:F-box domain-containing protein [Cinnamomum micranthum f. kanehirae]|uniref:F-box domain-containing protein n=1 Tax=Cinnamomum micranthum f. kanehirae TaxID=337451 RepID=A0A3S3N5Q7_9MAGN|nr:F-box domain-containing protein [Cinnamomum micranthum f. kanehirae]